MLTRKIYESRDGFALLALIALVLLSPSLFSAAFDEPGVVKAKTVVAQAFVLRGAGGNRIHATFQASDKTSLWFNGGDRYHKERLIAQTDKEGRPSIRFVDPANNMLKELTADLK
jgi:hypothetical protein